MILGEASLWRCGFTDNEETHDEVGVVVVVVVGGGGGGGGGGEILLKIFG